MNKTNLYHKFVFKKINYTLKISAKNTISYLNHYKLKNYFFKRLTYIFSNKTKLLKKEIIFHIT